jgi:hypothetical protein
MQLLEEEEHIAVQLQSIVLVEHQVDLLGVGLSTDEGK